MIRTQLPSEARDRARQPEHDDGALRIAVVTETYPPEVNGVALTLARVVRSLAARGHEVTLVRPRQAGDAERDFVVDAHLAQHLVSGLPIPRYPHLRMGLPAGALLQRLWTTRRPDVVHVATEGPLGWSAVRAARRLAIPVTSDFRTNFHAYAGHYGAAWLRRPMLGYLRAFHNRTAATTVPTEALRRQLQGDGFHNLAVVSRGVDVGHFDPALRSLELRRRWQAEATDPVVLYVGRLAAEKNLDLLVRSMQAIRAAHPRARLVLVGDGPLREALQAQLPQAVFAGQRHGAELAAHYASADLFLFPSLTETFGNVVVEAMASGLAVVAFDCAAAAQLIEPGRSGELVACDNEAQFERSAIALAGSRATREALGRQARRRATAYGWDTVLGSFEAVLRRAIGAGAGHAGSSRGGTLAEAGLARGAAAKLAAPR
ncbi:MAG: glycosyltransferase family 1 protein [Burkholderiales bacterium]|nr:glycosyltransferase family 1 protein [Burkholderiales bacterium]